eukprot:TRINITY_DN778_c0_g1_i3.p1 TRINITY_DN778_c0_g1~~TRINITY_DN778_c0_g1_i3.p1  ORF type:complete len:339 (-),score=95.71 TRINITY_DN778_c0_g1_i3:96-1112(-)
MLKVVHHDRSMVGRAGRGKDLHLDDEPIQLRRFVHQVAGHGTLYVTNGNRLCKFIKSREFDFYETYLAQLPRLQEFCCQYYGWLDFTFIGDDDEETEEEGLKASPSMEAMEKEILDEIAKRRSGQRFIILEDLTHPFRKPCVLDLKLGKQQHGPDAPEWKQQIQIKKCSRTTSATLGVRMCGLRVYNKRESWYTSRSKYEGRKVTEDRMPESMAPFFNNGVVFRADIVAFFIKRLEKLLEVFLEQKSLRFYSSSILLIYEGDETEESSEILGLPHCDLRMVDFANVYDYNDGEVDSGYIIGLRSTIRILQDILRMHEEGRSFSLFDEDLGENDDDHLG